MGKGYRLSQWASPELKECANPKCDYLFWGYGSQHYCSPECAKKVTSVKNTEYLRKYRKENRKKVREYEKKSYIKIKFKRGDKLTCDECLYFGYCPFDVGECPYESKNTI